MTTIFGGNAFPPPFEYPRALSPTTQDKHALSIDFQPMLPNQVYTIGLYLCIFSNHHPPLCDGILASLKLNSLAIGVDLLAKVADLQGNSEIMV